MNQNLQAFFDNHKVILAPMAGVSDKVFRSLCIECGASLTYTEMVSAKGLSYANEKTQHLLDLAENEREVAVQLFGHEPKTMAHEAAYVEQVLAGRLAYIDINMGCPARKIVSKGDGSALMKTPVLAQEIVSEVSGAVACPTTVKFRRGFEVGFETAPEFARAMQDAGAAAVCVHGRYSKQMYRGMSDVSCIARVVRAVSIPVIGNGDITNAASALSMLEQTGCAAVMVGRAARGNPWVFGQVNAALQGREVPAYPSVDQRIEMAKRHATMLGHTHGNKNIVGMRKHAMWYVAGLPGAAAARARLNDCTTLSQFHETFDTLLKEAKQHA